MATTAGILNGTLLILEVEGTEIANSQTHTLNVSMSTRETTVKSSAGWKSILEGLREWSIDCSGLVAFDAAYGFSDLLALVTGRTKVTLKFTSNVSGNDYWTGDAYITSLSLEAGTEDNVSFSATFEGAGVLTEKTLT